MGIKFSNFAASISSGPVSSTDVAITLAQDGDLFPVLGVGDYFYAVLVDNIQRPTKREIIKVEARAGNALSSITRGVDGTSAQNFDLAYVLHRWVRQAIVEVGSGGIAGALLAVNNLTDLANVATARENLGLGPTDSPTFTGLTCTGTIDARKLLLQEVVPAGSEILISSELGVTDNNGDSAAIRGFIATGGTATNHAIRAVEAQASRPAGTGADPIWGIEVGVHSQVAGSGTTNIGIVCLSSHTGWLPSGVRNDIAYHAAGEDGWKYGYTYYDIDNTTVLYSVDQFGLVYGVTAMFGDDRLDQVLATPRVCLQIPASGAAVNETRFSLYYNAATNEAVIEALTQGTAWRDILLAPSGGNTLVGTSTQEDTTHRLQVGGPMRATQFIANRTWTDNANLERIWMGWSGTAGRIHVENLGTGVARALGIYAGAGIFFGGAGTGANHWSVASTGHWTPMAPTTYTVGTAAAPIKDLYVGNSIFQTAPTTVTGATATVGAADNFIIADRAGTVTLTLPAVGSNTGRRLIVKTIQAQQVDSNAANVVPRAGGAAGTAIVPNVDGSWCEMVCDGANWIIMASS